MAEKDDFWDGNMFVSQFTGLKLLEHIKDTIESDPSISGKCKPVIYDNDYLDIEKTGWNGKPNQRIFLRVVPLSDGTIKLRAKTVFPYKKLVFNVVHRELEKMGYKMIVDSGTTLIGDNTSDNGIKYNRVRFKYGVNADMVESIANDLGVDPSKIVDSIETYVLAHLILGDTG